MLRRTLLGGCISLWLLNHGCGSTPSLLGLCGVLCFLLVSENEICVTRAPFPRIPWNSEPVTTRGFQKLVSAGFLVVEETLRELRRVLLWRRQQRPESKERVYFVTDAVWELCDTLSFVLASRSATRQVFLRMRCYAARSHTILKTATSCRCVNLCSDLEYGCLILWA
jgi:hypothetical protein